jgi:diguanylate cyclase (GGDEF)-like protein/PAS domain S-box-containing protein
MLFIVAFGIYITAEKRVNRAHEQLLTSFELSYELRQSSDDLTRMVRTYIATGNPIYKQHYLEILAIRDGKSPRPVNYGHVYWDLVLNDDARPRSFGKAISILDLMRQAGFTANEFKYLQSAKAASDWLTSTEFKAMALVESTTPPTEAHRNTAMQMLGDADYHQAKQNIMRQIGKSVDLVDQRTLSTVDDAKLNLGRIRLVFIALGIALVFMLTRTLYLIKAETREKKQGEALLKSAGVALGKSEEGFRLMVESVRDYAIIMVDTNGNITSWNTGAELLKGYRAEEIIGQNFSRFFTTEDIAAGKPSWLMKTALEQGRVKDEGWRVRKDGSRFIADFVMTPIYDNDHQLTGFAKVTRDITLRKQNELRIEHLNRLYATLSQINETLVRVKDKERLFPSICRVAVESGKFGLAWIGVLDPASGVVTPASEYGEVAVSLPFASINIEEAPFRSDIIGTVVETGKVVACKNIQTDPAMQQWRAMAIANGFHSAASVPIRQGDAIVALLNLFSSDMEMFTDEEEINLLKEIGTDVSFALDMLHLAALQRQTEASLMQSEQRFRDMFEGHSAIMLVIDPETGFILEANKAAIAFYGWSIDDMRKLRIQDINTLSPEEIQTAIEQTKSGEKNYFLFRHRRADGSIRDIEAYSRTIVTDGRASLYIIVHDVTDRKHYQLTTELHIALLEMVGNHSIEELLQLTLDKAEQLTESSIGFFHFVSDDHTSLSLQAWSTNTKKHMCTAVGEGRHYALDSAGVWADAARQKKAIIHNDYAALKNRKGMPEGHATVTREVVVPVIRAQKVVAILGVGNKGTPYDEQDVRWISIVADIAWDIVAKKMGEDERKLLQAQKYAIELLAMHDALTGLPNRRLFSERIKLTIALCERSNTIAALLMFDLDKFKPVNDTYGHEIGDLLLQEVSNRTLAILQRSSDTLARLGGDEFVVLLPKIEALSNAEAVAEKIRKALAEPFLIEGHTLSISSSIGIAIIPDHGQTELTIMKNADDAMYLSKSHGRNCITVYRP